MDTSALRVIIVDDQPVFRLGLRHALEGACGIEIAGESPASHQAVALISARRPHIALVSVDGSAGSGFDIVHRLNRQVPETTIIAMTGAEDATELLEAVRSNAKAYISKFATGPDILKVVQRVGSGEIPIHDTISGKQEVARRLLTEYQSMAAGAYPRQAAAPLSPREMEILRLMGQGRSNKEIGRRLGITEQTVKNHISSILRKLDVEDRMQAVLTGLRRHWISLDPSDSGETSPALAAAFSAQHPLPAMS